jgi:hypothetical protein
MQNLCWNNLLKRIKENKMGLVGGDKLASGGRKASFAAGPGGTRITDEQWKAMFEPEERSSDTDAKTPRDFGLDTDEIVVVKTGI